MIGLLADHFHEIGDRLLVCALDQVSEAAPVIGFEKFRIQGDRLGIVANRQIIPFLPAVRFGAGEENFLVVWIEFVGRGEIVDRALVIPHRVIGLAPVQQNNRLAQVDPGFRQNRGTDADPLRRVRFGIEADRTGRIELCLRNDAIDADHRQAGGKKTN